MSTKDDTNVREGGVLTKDGLNWLNLLFTLFTLDDDEDDDALTGRLLVSNSIGIDTKLDEVDAEDVFLKFSLEADNGLMRFASSSARFR